METRAILLKKIERDIVAGQLHLRFAGQRCQLALDMKTKSHAWFEESARHLSGEGPYRHCNPNRCARVSSYQ